jgi:hypothetical protein
MNKTSKYTMEKTKELLYGEYCHYDDIDVDDDIDWKIVFFLLLMAVREDFDTKDDEEKADSA